MASSTKTYQITNRTRTEWRGSTQSVSLDPMSMNSWNTCSICLHAARNPYCCPNGDVFCKECSLELILSNTEIKKEKEEKQPDQKEIDMFLRNQRIAPNDWNINENGTKIIKKNKRKVRCLCPACKKRIKWKDMLQLEYDESKEGPICCGCEKIMNGNIKTERLACNHVICSDCFKYMVEVDKQCPKCGKDIVQPEKSILLNKTLLSKIEAGGYITIKAEGTISSFG